MCLCNGFDIRVERYCTTRRSGSVRWGCRHGGDVGHQAAVRKSRRRGRRGLKMTESGEQVECGELSAAPFLLVNLHGF